MSDSLPFPARVQHCADHLARYGVSGLSALFDLTSVRLVRYATTLTRNQHDAEDVVQAVLVRVGAEPELLAAAECSWAYLLRMTRNEALGLLRRRRRGEYPEAFESRVGTADLLIRRQVDELERQETHRVVWLALREIPEEQAEVVVLRIWEGMTLLEISQLLDVSPNTVASRYQYALQKLEQKLIKLGKESYA
jgi:RNA polymerase sigma-70 factor (ECF subfamily)